MFDPRTDAKGGSSQKRCVNLNHDRRPHTAVCDGGDAPAVRRSGPLEQIKQTALFRSRKEAQFPNLIFAQLSDQLNVLAAELL